MTLQEALNKAVQEFGKSVLTEQRLINILNDYHAFDEMRSARHIISIIQKDNYMIDIIDDASYSVFKANQLASQLHNHYGVDEAIVVDIVQSILNAIRLPISTEFAQEELDKSWADTLGIYYSNDGQKLLCIENKVIFYYYIMPGTKIICDRAFHLCITLKSIILPEGLTHIGNGSFFGCGSLQSITFPKSLTSIGNYAFYGCVSLQSITLPNGVTRIENNAFSFCKLLQFISLPGGVHISSDAFNDCDSLVKIYIPMGSRSHFEKELPKKLHEKLVEQ